MNIRHYQVHGGIRHLENQNRVGLPVWPVHGGIRHLEIQTLQPATSLKVHGGIRHLEIFRQILGG